MVSLLGPSGCGKTTTLRIIAGLIAPTKGEIYIGGRPMASVPVHRRNIGMLFQNYALFPHLSVAHNVAFGLDMRGIGRAETTRRVREALQLVQLGPFEDRLPAELSGGQQQRVALARALVIEPSVLLLDEPLGALDKGLRESMQVELRQLQQRLGITSVIVTHDQEEALTLSDRIVVMRAGRLEQVGTPQQIYARPVSRFVAGFIGASNFLQGRVVEQTGGSVLVELENGSRLTVPPTGAPVTTGQTVYLAVRPEAIALVPNDDVERGAGLAIGTLVGATAGYFGGWLDTVLVRLTEIFQTVPTFLLVIVLAAISKPTAALIALSIGVASWPTVARLVRAQFRALRESEFVLAARSLGYSAPRIILFEIFPNAAAPIVVTTSVMVTNAILTEAGLSFLNMGDPNLISWGSMIGGGRPLLRTAWFLTALPGTAIALTVLALNLVGDGLNDVLNPRSNTQ